MLLSLSLISALVAIAQLISVAALVHSDSTPNEDDAALLHTLSQHITLSAELDLNAIKSERLPYRFFKSKKLKSSSRKRQSQGHGDGHWQILHSRKAVNGTAGMLLRAMPVGPPDLKALLERAIVDATLHTALDLSNSFTSYANRLRLFMTSVDDHPTSESFNWQDYRSVAEILLKSVINEPESTTSIVGVIVDPQGRRAVDVVSLPAFVHVRVNGSVEFAHPPRTRAPPKMPDTVENLPRRHVSSSSTSKRDVTTRIEGTTMTLQMRRTSHRVTAQALYWLADFVVNMVLADTNYRADDDPAFAYGYTALQTADRFRENSMAKRLFGDLVFRFATTTARQIDEKDMLRIVRAIDEFVRKYTNHVARGEKVASIAGKVLDSGQAIAQWSIGLSAESAASVCTEAVVIQPDGTQALGCLVS
ncbi:MAG: hypothetical protein M1817_003026 [Caeruleum heppii]|nr:MAG: hypothetical protein M1817_003026 [Caeruleum heppii]